jgi:predicted Zn-dependent protease
VVLRSDPTDPRFPSPPFANDGLPLQKVTWIDRGVIKALASNRFWAKKQGTAPLPMPRSLFLEAAEPTQAKDLVELVRGVERGVLVTRLWYNRMLEPRQILATGLTRDGTFKIENGKLAGPVKNMRYNESPAALLKNLVAIGKPERVTGEGRVTVVPPLVAKEFHFASVSDAV